MGNVHLRVIPLGGGKGTGVLMHQFHQLGSSPSLRVIIPQHIWPVDLIGRGGSDGQRKPQTDRKYVLQLQVGSTCSEKARAEGMQSGYQMCLL